MRHLRLDLLALLLAFPLTHDLLIQAEFQALVSLQIKIVEANLDREKKGGEGLDSRIRYIDCDDEKTIQFLEYELYLVTPYLTEDGHPKILLKYCRKSRR